MHDTHGEASEIDVSFCYFSSNFEICRLTNKLAIMKGSLLKAMWKHTHAWPFHTPVDTVVSCFMCEVCTQKYLFCFQKLNLPDYFDIIKKPMDMGSIRKRLESNYYWSADEAIADFNQMFTNCYIYNKPGEDIVVMAKNLEKFFLSKVRALPQEEFVVDSDGVKAPNKTKKVSKVAPPGSSSVVAPIRPPIRPIVAAPSNRPVTPVGQQGGVKRKAESAISPQGLLTTKASVGVSDLGLPSGITLTPTKKLDPIGSAGKFKDSSLPGRSEDLKPKHRLSESLKFCMEVLREMFGKKHSGYAWPFYKPVDALTLGLHDYHDIIKKSMDLGTIKLKMDRREYKSAEEFEEDVLLIFKNCYQYNPPEHDVVGMARKLEEVFLERMAELPKDSPDVNAVPGPSPAGLARLQPEVDGESDQGADTSEWNKRLMQVQEQMRQLSQQIQMLVEESTARRKRRLHQHPGSAPGSVKKKEPASSFISNSQVLQILLKWKGLAIALNHAGPIVTSSC